MNKPAGINPLANEILERLSHRPEAVEIVLGGYLALQHYVDYRETNDIDAWWRVRATPSAEGAIREVMQQVGNERGFDLKERRFGETLSIELMRAGRKQFSFQIAIRSVELESPMLSPWPPILIETLSDNVGAKMNALVERGSPRDFLDIRLVVQRGLMSIADCWELWSRKNAGQCLSGAKQRVLLGLAALEARRPLAGIKSETDREQARVTREWFKAEFLKE